MKINLTGKRFENLVVIKEAAPINFVGKKALRRWVIQCFCGRIFETDQMHLTRTQKPTKSCGCISKRKKYMTKSTTHYRRLYNIWHKMKYRCEIPSCSDYHKYGKRGIRVSDEWQSFVNFYNDMIDSYSPGLTIERIDVNGNYCKENCTWIPAIQQAKNRRTTIWINGVCAKDACHKAGINYHKFLSLNKDYTDPVSCFEDLTAQSYPHLVILYPWKGV